MRGRSDWDSGARKSACPDGLRLIGLAHQGNRGRCTDTGGAGFDRSDNRPSGNPGGEFATGQYKGQCANDEYAAGVAWTGRIGSSRTPDALYCRRLA